MSNLADFLHQAFPTKKRTVFFGLGYGILLVAINWYLPMLLKNTDPPKWLINTLVFILMGIILWLVLTEKLWTFNLGIVGWAAIGYLATGIILVCLIRNESSDAFGKPSAVLFSGILILAAYIIVLLLKLKNKKDY